MRELTGGDIGLEWRLLPVDDRQDVSLYDYTVNHSALGQAGHIVVKGKFYGSTTSVSFRNNVVRAGEKGK